ncbi:MAG: regulatory protein RecX [Luteibaculaceae bacterium]
MIDRKEDAPFNYGKIYSKLMHFCALRERCTHDVLKKMEVLGVPASEKSDLIKKLTEESFLDDNRFLEAFINDKAKYQKWGKLKIANALRQKGFSNQDFLSVYERGEVPDFQVIQLKELAQKKWETLKTKSTTPQQKKASLIRYLAQKGYPASAVYASVNHLV